jgi:hypothetical protein
MRLDCDPVIRLMEPDAWISLAVPGRLMRSLVAEGPGTPYGVRDRTGPRASAAPSRTPADSLVLPCLGAEQYRAPEIPADAEGVTSP